MCHISVFDLNWDAEQNEWLHLHLSHDVPNGDQALLGMNEWDHVVPETRSHYFWFDLADVPIGEWVRLSLWNDPVEGMIRGDVRRVSDDQLIMEGSFAPQNLSTIPLIGTLKIGVQELEWQYLDNVSVTLQPCPFVLAGDLNNDCGIDLRDFAIMVSHWLIDCWQSPTDPACIPK